MEDSQTVSLTRCHSWPISITPDRFAENSFERLCAMAFHCLMDCVRGTSLLPASFIHHRLLHHHRNSLQPSLSLHSSHSSPHLRALHRVPLSDLRGSHGVFPSDLRGSHGVFLSVMVKVTHTNAFDRPLPGVVISVSATTSVAPTSVLLFQCQPYSWSCHPTPAGIRSCGVTPGSTVL